MTTLTAKKRSTLDIQSEGLNVLSSFCIEAVNHFTPLLKTLIGKKIVLADGSKAKEFKAMPALQTRDIKQESPKKFISFQYWFEFSGALRLNCKICIHGGSYDDNTYYCVYLEKSMWLGKVANQILLSVADAEMTIKDYKLTQTFTEKELSELITNYESLKTKARDAYFLIPDSVKKEKFLTW